MTTPPTWPVTLAVPVAWVRVPGPLGALKVTVVVQFGEGSVALVVRQMPPSTVATQTSLALKGLTATAWMAPTFCWICEVGAKLIPAALGLPVEVGPCATQVGAG